MRCENYARKLLINFNDFTSDKLLQDTIDSQSRKNACGKLEPVDICVRRKPVKLKLRGRKKGVTRMTARVRRPSPDARGVGVGQYCTGTSGLVRW